MHPRVIAERQAGAFLRMVAAIEKIAVTSGVEAPKLSAIREKSPAVQRIKEFEALATWLEALSKPKKAKAENV